MGKQKNQVSEAELLRQHTRSMFLIDSISKNAKVFIIGMWVCTIVYVGVYLPIKETAGQVTTISVVQKWFIDANLHVYMAWGVAGACALGWRAERKKHLRERSERDKRIIELEREKDPNRTSSGMTVGGDEEAGGKK